ncbi:astacin-like [Limulus polyphemus]|uniref:Metalloendopeptidase n=1 Tax=Limulus polyphemus TaxID=6850 RepID=A0ABM1SPY7_LIMPO|nr:astacin-like [Limulus polyphemus]
MLLVLFCVFVSALALPESSYDNFNETHWSPLEGELFEGDIKLLPSQYDENRNALLNRAKRWTGKTVYYQISSTYSSSQRNLILQAMEEYHKNTCIRFIQRTNQQNYLNIYPDSVGCWSYFGMIGGGQKLSLQIPGCMYKGLIMHELMHALGFTHEQSRADRDNYVTINWDNISENQKYNFNKFTLSYIDHLGESYDYRSIMHYHAWSFALNRNYPTLTPKLSGFTLNDLGAGQRNNQFTATDVRKIKNYYQC